MRKVCSNKLIGWALGALLITAAPSATADQVDELLSATRSGDYKVLLGYWGPLAERGDPQAQFNLGLMYHAGMGVARDEAEAVRWYQKAAKNGHRRAQEYLVVGYQEGWFGLPQDTRLALYWESQIEATAQ